MKPTIRVTTSKSKSKTRMKLKRAEHRVSIKIMDVLRRDYTDQRQPLQLLIDDHEFVFKDDSNNHMVQKIDKFRIFRLK